METVGFKGRISEDQVAVLGGTWKERYNTLVHAPTAGSCKLGMSQKSLDFSWEFDLKTPNPHKPPAHACSLNANLQRTDHTPTPDFASSVWFLLV